MTWLVGSLLLAIVLGAATLITHADERRYTIAFANLTEEPGVTLEGTGFTGQDVRQSFVLAARGQPVDLVLYDNQRDGARAMANADDAIHRKVDLFVQYFPDASANQRVVDKLRDAGIPVITVNSPVANAPLYAADNRAAGKIAGDALVNFATGAWRGQAPIAVILGNLSDQPDGVPHRAEGVREALSRVIPASRIVALDTRGNTGQVAALLGKTLAAHPNTKVLIAAMDDATALSAKAALESSGRLADAAIVSQGCDRSVHGGVSDRKEIDPNNRGSILIGSVAFFLDRYGYDILPLALRMLRGEAPPARTLTRHTLVTAANVWREYPPYDMQ